MNRSLAVILILSLSSIALAQQDQDALKQRILVQAEGVSANDYAFTRTVRTEQTFSGKAEQTVIVENFDPAKSSESRWALVSVDGAAPSADTLRKFQAEAAKRRVPGYYRLAACFATPATASTDSQGRTVFHFASLPKDTVKVMETDVSQSASADAIVKATNGVAFVEQVRTIMKPVRIKLLIKLERYESIARYRMGPEGWPQLIEQTADFSGSGMGRAGHGHTVITYSDYRAAGLQR